MIIGLNQKINLRNYEQKLFYKHHQDVCLHFLVAHIVFGILCRFSIFMIDDVMIVTIQSDIMITVTNKMQ